MYNISHKKHIKTQSGCVSTLNFNAFTQMSTEKSAGTIILHGTYHFIYLQLWSYENEIEGFLINHLYHKLQHNTTANTIH